jgi:hypothetical protein
MIIFLLGGGFESYVTVGDVEMIIISYIQKMGIWHLIFDPKLYHIVTTKWWVTIIIWFAFVWPNSDGGFNWLSYHPKNIVQGFYRDRFLDNVAGRIQCQGVILIHFKGTGWNVAL